MVAGLEGGGGARRAIIVGGLQASGPGLRFYAKFMATRRPSDCRWLIARRALTARRRGGRRAYGLLFVYTALLTFGFAADDETGGIWYHGSRVLGSRTVGKSFTEICMPITY